MTICICQLRKYVSKFVHQFSGAKRRQQSLQGSNPQAAFLFAGTAARKCSQDPEKNKLVNFVRTFFEMSFMSQ
jgi:hypothetical protein